MVAAFLDAATSCESDLTEGLSDYGLSDRQRIERAISEIIEHLRRRP